MVAPDAIISVQEVSKNFRSVAAVDGASFEIGSGEIFGLLGPNGAGKTTLIRLILDLIRPDAGSIRIQGQPISEAHKNRIGYLPEERGLYYRQKVMAVLEYLGTLKGVSIERVRGNARDWLKRLEIDDLRNRPVQELSKGNQQKVQFIATVVSDPDILILDEPFTGLDPINVHLLVRSIRELAAEGKTVVLSVHQMSLWIRWVPGDVTVKYLFRKYYETIGPSRIIFGTDSSWFPRGFTIEYLQDQMRSCLDLNFPEQDIQQIFAGNAARLLKIDL